MALELYPQAELNLPLVVLRCGPDGPGGGIRERSKTENLRVRQIEYGMVQRIEEVRPERQKEAIVRIVKMMAERSAGAAVQGIVEEASERARAVLEDVRHAGRAAAEDLDARIRRVLDEALAEQVIPSLRKRATRRRRKSPGR